MAHHTALLTVAFLTFTASTTATYIRTAAGNFDIQRHSLSVHSVGPQTAGRRRALLAQSHGQGQDQSLQTKHMHHSHHAWGQLCNHHNYLLALEGSALQRPVQDKILAGIEALGSTVTSILNPSTWIVTASAQTAEWMAQIPNTTLAKYPDHLKIAPEWFQMAQQEGLQRLYQDLQGMLEELQQQAVPVRGDEDESVFKAALHEEEEEKEDDDASDTFMATYLGKPHQHRRIENDTNTVKTQSIEESGDSTSHGADDVMLLIDVVFPAFTKGDMERLGLTRPRIPYNLFNRGGKLYALEKRGQPVMVIASGNGTFIPAMAAALDWNDNLQTIAKHCGVDIMLQGHSLSVAVCEADAATVLKWLAQQPTVRWLSPRMQSRTYNQDAAVITQTGGLSETAEPTDLSLHPLWRAGIDGTGQIVGSGDTGVDMNSCFFKDTDNPFSNFANNQYNNPRHRKVVFYDALSDFRDASGHGTHVAGTIAGSIQGYDPSAQRPSEGTGIAPGARLAVLDLSKSNSDLISRPGDLAGDYYPNTYDLGARIHSDSWGSDNSVYDFACAQVDQFTWDHPDFLPIFAAGNDERVRMVTNAVFTTTPTIRSPALAKNAIAVGATMTMRDTTLASGPSYVAYNITISIPDGGSSSYAYSALMVAANFGGSWEDLKGRSLGLSGAEPRDACSGLNSQAVSGFVVVAERSSSCTYSEQLANAQAAGAIAVIVTNNIQQGYFPMNAADSVEYTAPLGGVPLSIGRHMWDAVSNGPGAARVTVADRGPLGAFYDVLAYFSSFGPASDGRIKPDVVAPGVLVSAKSGGAAPDANSPCQSDTELMQGTSMATPVVAGNAALIRQYFADGFYPTGSKVAENKYPTPSGALVRAVLVAGATPLRGNIHPANPTAGGLPVEAPPSVRQGWGRVDLSSLPLQDAGKGWSMQVVDLANITQGEVHRYCVTSTGGPFRVALVWHDLPGDVAADPKATQLVNNLDLEVRAAGYGGLQMLGNGNNDTVNNVETVLLDYLPTGNVSITVTGNRVSSRADKQPYAMVVVGKFSGILQSPSNPVGGSTTTSGSCVITLAVIDDTLSTTQPITNDNDLSFVFSTQSGIASAGGFQCQMLDGKVNNTDNLKAPYHVWRACSSPAPYQDVPDGVYVFQVRSFGEDVVDTRRVVVDTKPPTTTVATSVAALTAAVAEAAPGTAPATIAVTEPNITFTFSAEDATSVTYKCMLQLTSTVPATYYTTDKANGGLQPDGVMSTCVSPLSVYGLSYGDWVLTVVASDAAGNVDRTGKIVAWSETYQAGVTYARLSAFPPALTNQKVLGFSLYAFTGVEGGPPSNATSASFQYRFWQSGTAEPPDWNTSTSANVNVQPTSDGTWLFRARPSAATLAAASVAATVVVDTTPPVVSILEVPPVYSKASTMTIRYTTDTPEAVVYQCRWLTNATAEIDKATPAVGDAAFGSCGDTSAPEVSSRSVTNGWWLFQVRAIDAAGNIGRPANASFLTDLDPPIITSNVVGNAIYTRNPAINITYSVTDNIGGSGVANFSCTMQPRAVLPRPSQNFTRPGSGFITPVGSTQAPCPQPALYAIQEGRYQFVLTTQDRTGSTTTLDVVVVLDVQAPVTSVTTRIPQEGGAFPSAFRMLYTGIDEPKGLYSSGIKVTECMMTALPPGSDNLITKPNTGSTTPTSGNSTSNSTSGVSTSGSVTAGRRRALLQSTDGNPTMLESKVPVVYGTWQDCSAADPSRGSILYQGLVSGIYSFKVRSTDNSGNAGNASKEFVFRVDDTLPIDPATGVPVNPSDSGTKLKLNKLAIGIIIGLGALLIISIIAAVVILRSRAKARERQYAANGGGANGHYPAGPFAAGTHYPYNPQALAASREADRQRQEEERVRRAIQASLEEDNMRKALEASKQDYGRRGEEARIQAAIQASLAAAQQRPHSRNGYGF